MTRRDYLALVLLLGALALYSVTVGHGYVYDDHLTLPRLTPHGFDPGDQHPLTSWTFDLQAGQSAGALHLANVALHLLNGALLYLWLCRRVTGLAVPLGLLVWLFHPLQADAVAYLSARSDLLVGLGVVVAAWGTQVRPWWARWILYLLGAGIMVAAKPTGIFGLIPAALVVWAAAPRGDRMVWLVLTISALVVLATAIAAAPLNDTGVTRWDLLRAAQGEWHWHSWMAVQVFAAAAWLSSFALPWLFSVDPTWIVERVPAWEVELVAGALGLATLSLLATPDWPRRLALWLVACVGWRLILPHTEPFGGPGDGYVLVLGVAAWVAALDGSLLTRDDAHGHR